MTKRRLPCSDCERTFRGEFALAQHRADAHGADHPFECRACIRRFGSERTFELHNRMMHPDPPVCMECGEQSRLTTGSQIYPNREDLFTMPFYICECGAYCGCHPDTRSPLGYPAGRETRRARTAAHAALDGLWRSGQMTRSEAYIWLRKSMGLDAEFCHIGMMTAAQARQVVVLVEALERDKAA